MVSGALFSDALVSVALVSDALVSDELVPEFSNFSTAGMLANILAHRGGVATVEEALPKWSLTSGLARIGEGNEGIKEHQDGEVSSARGRMHPPQQRWETESNGWFSRSHDSLDGATAERRVLYDAA